MKMKIKLQTEPGFTQQARYGFTIFQPISSPSKLVVITPRGKSKSACRTANT